MKPHITPNLFSSLRNLMGTAILAAVTTAFSAAGAEAVTFSNPVTFSFNNATSNNTSNVAAGKSQLFLDLIDTQSSQVVFKFRNEGPAASGITQIYFDDVDSSPFLLRNTFTDSRISDSDGTGDAVQYNSLANGGTLPGGNTLKPKFDEDFNFSPVAKGGGVGNRGVDPGEWVSFLFDLAGGKTFDGLLAAIADNSFRVGFHVQSFANGGSESFVNKPTPNPSSSPSPEPSPSVSPSPEPSPSVSPSPEPSPSVSPSPEPSPSVSPSPEPSPSVSPSPEPSPEPSPSVSPSPEPSPEPSPSVSPSPEPSPEPSPKSVPEPVSIAGLVALGATLRTMKRRRNKD